MNLYRKPRTIIRREKWLTKVEAATILGVSLKTIERLAKAKKITKGLLKRKDGRTVCMYRPADVEKLRESRQLEASIIEPAVDAGEPVQRRRRRAYTAGEILMQIVETLSVPRASEKLLLNAKEAAEFAGLSESQFEAAIESGAIKTVRIGGSRLVKRSEVITFVDQYPVG